MPAALGRLDRIVEDVGRDPAVEWVRWNGPFQRLIVAHRGDAEAALAAVRAAERANGLVDLPFAPDPPIHPGDAALRTRAAVRALEHVPQLRHRVDRYLGGARADLALGLLGSASAALAGGSVGQAVGLVYRLLHLRELAAQREAWARREPELAGRPTDHPREPLPGGQRTCPLPKGPIERYSEQAGVASLGGFGFGLAATGHAEQAAASILGAVPKPARIGRESFGAALGLGLARHGVVVMDHRALRRLDRITALVLPQALLGRAFGQLDEVASLSGRRCAEIQLRAHRMLEPGDPTGERRDGRWRLAPLPEPLPEEARAWFAGRPRRHQAASMALLALGGGQLGQTLWLGWRNPPVAAAALASGAALLLIVQTPGLSRLAGCRPVGPLGLAQVGAAVALGTLAAGLGPELWQRADSRYGFSERLLDLRDEQWVRWLAESRLVQRIRTTLQPVETTLTQLESHLTQEETALQRDLIAS